eukprot:c10889_g1_i1.p1 GENE.c10889_g1_i1~~c10889_g1_i1.p1  ORF type:complete len:133 (-),score=25.14 c10889_g1_i1:121-519(-)
MSLLQGPNSTAIGIDRVPGLVQLSLDNTRKSHALLLEHKRIRFLLSDGHLGFKDMAPYDAIHVGAAASHIPPELIDQLAIGGRMIIPVGTHEQDFLQVDKKSDGQVEVRNLFGVVYVPLIPDPSHSSPTEFK